MDKLIQVTKSSMPPLEEYIDEIKGIWETHWLTNSGAKHQELESRLKMYFGTKNIALFTNGHLALETAIAALKMEGEVITTPFTFASTTHAIVRNGLKPVFCDITRENYTMDTTKIEELITENTCAILPVHVYGNVCNVDEIQQLADKYNLKVIYDAAHTFGVTVNGTGIGNFGDVSMFSFHATKVFNTIEGGALTYRDNKLQSLFSAMKNFGMTGPESVEYIGGNAKMNEFQAAMGLCNLRYVDEEIQKRKMIAGRYTENLSGIEGIKLSIVPNGVKSNYAYFPIVFDGFKKNRDEVLEELKADNIIARKYFYPLTNSFKCYHGEFDTDKTPTAKYISERVLTLPLYADLEFEDVDRICRLIKQ